VAASRVTDQPWEFPPWPRMPPGNVHGSRLRRERRSVFGYAEHRRTAARGRGRPVAEFRPVDRSAAAADRGPGAAGWIPRTVSAPKLSSNDGCTSTDQGAGGQWVRPGNTLNVRASPISSTSSTGIRCGGVFVGIGRGSPTGLTLGYRQARRGGPNSPLHTIGDRTMGHEFHRTNSQRFARQLSARPWVYSGA